jgi:hypothetical protein
VKIIPKSTENLLHQKRERCKGNIELERDAAATDYRDKGREADREAHMTSAARHILSYYSQLMFHNK